MGLEQITGTQTAPPVLTDEQMSALQEAPPQPQTQVQKPVPVTLTDAEMGGLSRPSIGPLPAGAKTGTTWEDVGLKTPPAPKEAYGISADPKVNYWMDRVIPRLPMLLMPAAGYIFTPLVFEGLQQAKNVVMSLKDKSKYDPLAQRSLTELMSPNAPELVRTLVGAGEMAADMGIAMVAGKLTSPKILKNTINTIYEKGVAAGYPEDQMTAMKQMLNRDIPPGSVETEVKRAIGARQANIPKPKPTGIGGPEAPPPAEAVPPSKLSPSPVSPGESLAPIVATTTAPMPTAEMVRSPLTQAVIQPRMAVDIKPQPDGTIRIEMATPSPEAPKTPPATMTDAEMQAASTPDNKYIEGSVSYLPGIQEKVAMEIIKRESGRENPLTESEKEAIDVEVRAKEPTQNAPAMPAGQPESVPQPQTPLGGYTPTGKLPYQQTKSLDPQLVAQFKSQKRLGPKGEELGEFQGAGYQWPDKAAIQEEYRQWLRSDGYDAPKPPEGELFAQPKPVAPEAKVAPALTEPQMLQINTAVDSLTKSAWMGEDAPTREANRQALKTYAIEHYKTNPTEIEKNALDPTRLEHWVNFIKKRFSGGELRTRKVRETTVRESQLMEPTGKEGAISAEPSADASVFAEESRPKNKPPAEPIRESSMFRDEQEAVKVDNILRETARGDDRTYEILKGKLTPTTPETHKELAKRLGISEGRVSQIYSKALGELKDSEAIREVMKRHMKQMNLGPIPSSQDLDRLAKLTRKYFSSRKGADSKVDMENDIRVGERVAEIFDNTIDVGKIKKYIDANPVSGIDDFVLGLFRGERSGNGQQDIQASALPDDIKQAMLNVRDRVDRLSELIKTYGNLSDQAEAALENNLGKYLTKAYRLYDDKHWNPTPQAKQGYKDWLKREYGMTDDEAESFMNSELAYGRNDEGLRPFKKKRTKRVPTENLKRRKELSDEWKSFAGEIDRAAWLMQHTVVKQATMAYNAKFLSFISDYLPELWTTDATEAAKRGWQRGQLPSDYGYGKLRGAYVSPVLAQYIKNEVGFNRSDIEELLNKLFTNPFKWVHTIGSYPTHMRNFLGNPAFSVLGQCSIANPLNAPYYAKSLKVHLNKSGSMRDEWKSLLKNNVIGNQYWGNEVKGMFEEISRLDPASWSEKAYEKIVRWPINKAGEFYNAEDSLYRVAAWYKNKEHFKMSDAENIEEINRAYTDYRKLPVAVEYLRKYPVMGPFVSFTWNVGKIVGNQAVQASKEIQNPKTRAKGIGRWLRLAAIMSIPEIVSDISKKLADVDDEKIAELEKHYAQFRRGGSFLYFRGKDDKLKVFDMSYLWPFGNITRPIKAVLAGDIDSFADSINFMSVPWIDAYQIIVKGKDPAYGTEYAEFYDRAKALLQHFYLPASSPIPSIPGLLKGEIKAGIFTGPQIKKIIDAYNEQPTGRLQYKSEFPEEVKNFVTGIKTWSVDPERVLIQSLRSKRAESEAAKNNFMKWYQDNWKASDSTIESKKSALAKKINKIDDDINKIIKLKRELEKDGFLVKKHPEGYYAIGKEGD
ncbi:MAG: sigma factor-like helix-turn-helix DNA-binding protein [Dehalococcoidia bacterium]|jgi:hypothetical protein